MTGSILRHRHDCINKSYRRKLLKEDFTLICSNCFGGIFYHWLGLKFNSPFINLWLTNDDFIKAISNWDKFIEYPIIEDTESKEDYPVGISMDGIRIYFQHYKTFEEALSKWNIRKKRMNKDKLCFMLTNWNGDDGVVDQFDAIRQKNKIIFTDKPFVEYKSVVYLHNWNHSSNRNIWRTANIYGKRYIDDFDIVDYLNKL